MTFRATKREWGELYVFFHLLADEKVSFGTPQARKGDEECWPIAMIQREEHDGTQCYHIEGGDIRVEGEKIGKSLPCEDFATMIDLILNAIKGSSTDEVTSPDGVEEFLDGAEIFDFEARTEDRADFSIVFWHPEASLAGFNVRPCLGVMNPLLDGGHAANLKLEQSGVKFTAPTVNKINALPESPTEVTERMMMIERLGGALRYSDVTDHVFRCNLLMIDLHFPRVSTEVVRTMHLDGITRISELTELMKAISPLEIKGELIGKHGFYEFRMKQLLLTLALGIRPAKIYNGADSAVEDTLSADDNGEVLCYHKSEKKTFEDSLYLNLRLEKGPTDRDRRGLLERENDVHYFRLGAKIGLVKR